MNVVPVSHKRAAGASDGVLVQEAAAGSGAAFATLYDRYETPVYNYCLRLLNSAEDAADATQEAFVGILRRLQTDDTPVLDFSAYLFTAARNESYAVMRQRDRSRPAEAPPADTERAAAAVEGDPERTALIRDAQEEVRAANARLAPRHREVLALREVAGRSYEEIGAVLGVSANAAAQLLWRARTRLRDELRLGAVASVAAASEECERAQLLIGMREDGETLDSIDDTWLDRHLEECGNCRASRAMLLEVGASYRAWVPVAALVGLRETVLTNAGQVVGADWSGIAANGKQAGKVASNAGTAAAVGGVATIAAVGLALGVLNHGSNTSEPAAVAVSPPDNPAAAREAKAVAAHHAKKAKPDPVKVAVHPAAHRAVAPPAARPDVSSGAPRTTPPAPRHGTPHHGTPRPGTGPPAATPRPPAQGPPAQGPQEPRQPVGAPPEPVAEPPPAELPPAPPATNCSHPNGAPAGCPPGHGGTPPGQGGTPPGQGEPPPGQARGQQP